MLGDLYDFLVVKAEIALDSQQLVQGRFSVQHLLYERYIRAQVQKRSHEPAVNADGQESHLYT